MQEDFHYYATYCAAFMAGFSHKEALDIAYSAQLVDCCTRSYIGSVNGPASAATTQSQAELVNADMTMITIQDITRIWSSFHFLPYDLNAQFRRRCTRRYLNKYRLICKPNGTLVVDTVELAKKNNSLQAVGIAMHVLADTWAHSYFAGTPSFVINNVNQYFYEIIEEDGVKREEKIAFVHNPMVKENVDNRKYIGSPLQSKERSIVNLGHGRASHLPDYSYAVYKYMPAWGDYEVIIKDNPKDYYNAFCQMVYAMRYIRGDIEGFETEKYAYEIVEPYREEIDAIFKKRQQIASDDWRDFGEKLSGQAIEPFDDSQYKEDYLKEEDKDSTFLGRFFIGALSHKSMVTNRIYNSKNILAGVSIEYHEKGFKGIKDFRKLIQQLEER